MLKHEWSHIKSDNRSNNNILGILHPDFKEFGMSGKDFRKSDFEHIELDQDEYEISDFEECKLADDCILTTYTLTNFTTNTTSNRSSIWKLHDNDWKLFFHQGTKKK